MESSAVGDFLGIKSAGAQMLLRPNLPLVRRQACGACMRGNLPAKELFLQHQGKAVIDR